eukprot:121379_1
MSRDPCQSDSEADLSDSSSSSSDSSLDDSTDSDHSLTDLILDGKPKQSISVSLVGAGGGSATDGYWDDFKRKLADVGLRPRDIAGLERRELRRLLEDLGLDSMARAVVLTRYSRLNRAAHVAKLPIPSPHSSIPLGISDQSQSALMKNSSFRGAPLSQFQQLPSMKRSLSPRRLSASHLQWRQMANIKSAPHKGLSSRQKSAIDLPVSPHLKSKSQVSFLNVPDSDKRHKVLRKSSTSPASQTISQFENTSPTGTLDPKRSTSTRRRLSRGDLQNRHVSNVFAVPHRDRSKYFTFSPSSREDTIRARAGSQQSEEKHNAMSIRIEMADLQDTPLVPGTETAQPNSKVAGSFKSPTPASLSIRNVEAGAPETGGAKANIGWLRSQKLRRSVNAFCSRKCNRWFFPIAVMVYTIIAISVFWAVWARLTNQSLELIIRQQQTGLINRTSFISNSIYAPPLLMLRRAAVTFEALEVDTADLNTQRTDILQFFQKNIRNSDASGLFFANSAGDFLGAFRLSDNSEFYLTKDAADQKFLRLTTPDGVGSPTDLPLIADLTLEKWFTNVQTAPVSVTDILQPMQFSRLRGRIFSEPFPVVSSSSPRGVFGVEFPLSSFSRELGKLKISSEGLVFMVDTQTNVLFSSSVPNLEDEYGVTAASESRNMLIREAFKKYQTKNPTGTSGTLSGDELRLSFLSESDPSGEYIRFAVLPIDAYERPVRVAGTINGVFGIFCILLAILISWLSFKVVPSRIQLEKARIEEENALTPDPLGINNRVSIPPDLDFLSRLGLLKSESHIEIPDEVEGEIVTTHLSPKHHNRRGCLACLLPDDQDDLAARSSRVIGLMTAASILLLLMLVSIMAAWFAISEQAVTGKSASTRLELQTRLFGGLEAYLGFAEDTLQSLQAAPNSLYSNSNCQTFFSESLRSSGLTNRKSDEVQVTSVFAVLADESVCGAILNPETGTDILTVRRSAQQPSLTDKCVKIFDSTNQSQSMLCSFDPFPSLWYTNTVSNSEINWSTDASGLSSLPNIVVVSQRIESGDGSVLGVLGAEISLDYFSSYLQTLHVNPSKGGIRSNDFRIFVITPDYQLLSSSMAQTTPDCGSRCILQNSNADTVIETTSEFLQRDDTSPKLAEITEPQEIPRTIENPLTFIGPVKNSGWFGIITLSRQDVFNNNWTLTFLIAAFVTIIT